MIDPEIPATCTEDGLTAGVHCSVCNEILIPQEVITAAGHAEVVIPAVEATCTTAGSTEGKMCSVCGEILVAPETIPATGHTWDEGVVTTDATCTEDGVITYTCTVCGETRTEAIAPHGHEAVDMEEIAATCTAAGRTAGKQCSVCGAIIEGMELILPTGHTVVIDDAVSAACTGTGLTAGAHCSVCGEILVAQTEVPALGHTWDDGVVTTEPTYSKDGVKTFTCLRCGETRTETIPHLGLPCKDDEHCPGRIFTDMPPRGNWAHDPIDWAIVYEVTSGLTKTTFGPGQKITRGQVVTFLWRAAGRPEPTSSTNPFADVKSNGYYYKAVLWAVEKGITKGVSNTAFDPNGFCTRGQIVTFLYRYAGSPKVDNTGSKFTDVKSSAFYADAVAWAVANDITAGTSATKFSPENICTRAQTVTFLYRLVVGAE